MVKMYIALDKKGVHIKWYNIILWKDKLSVGNPRDQKTKCAEFVTIFSSASGRVF